MPDKGAAKAYGLLLQAMQESGKVAIARVVLRSKEQLVAIRPAPGGVLMMETMIFADEVVPPDEIDDLPEAKDLKASDREVKMAQQLIDSLSSDFEPDKYRDEYREKVLELIERKASGEEIAVQPEAPQPEKVPDLMAALEASLAAVKGDSTGNGKTEQPKKKPAASQEGRGEEVGRPRRAGVRYAASRSSSNQTRVSVVALDAPAVRELAHEVQAPARRARGVRLGLGQLEPRARGRRPRRAARGRRSRRRA